MKITKTTLLFIATLFVVALPLIFSAGNAAAYVGDTTCLQCHNFTYMTTNGHDASADKTSYVETGHANSARPYVGDPLLGPDGGELTRMRCGSDGKQECFDWANGTYDGSPLILVHHSWFDGDGAHTVTEASNSFNCAPCHTTGFKADNTGLITADSLGITVGSNSSYLWTPIAITNNQASWDGWSIQCERCHGEQTGHNGLTDSCTAPVDASYMAYKQRVEGTVGADHTEKCSSANRVTNYLYTNDGGATFYACDGTPTAFVTDGTQCDTGGPYIDHHPTVPADSYAMIDLCGQCHLQKHHTLDYLNSPKARFIGADHDYTNTANYSKTPKGCDYCHDVHKTTVTSTGSSLDSAFKQRCGYDCHGGSSRTGFHDNMLNVLAPSTVATEDYCRKHPEITNEGDCTAAGSTWYVKDTTAGVNFDACVACHMPDGSHRLLIDASGAATASAGIGDGEVPNGLDKVCMQCHDGSDDTIKEFTNMKALASGVSGGYHTNTSFVADTHEDCLKCHADKEPQLQTGHANKLRKVVPGTELTGPNGYKYPEIDDFSKTAGTVDWGTEGVPGSATITVNGVTKPIYYLVAGWLNYATPRAITVDANYSHCATCHTTGYEAGVWDDATLEPLKSFPSVGLVESNFGGQWKEDGIQCARCHQGTNTATEHVISVSDVSFTKSTALCNECHGQPAEFLNSPHGRFTGTIGEIADNTKYGSHFTDEATDQNMGCAGCHDVHQSVMVDGAKPFYNECGISCHGQDASTDSHAKPLAWINHPTGPGTPLYGVTADKAQEACVVCHMPGGKHLFRISADPSYTTPADAPDYTTANPAEQSVDLDLACGQCHGGGALAPTAEECASDTPPSNCPKEGVPYISKEALAPAAEVMHGTPVANTVNFTWWNDSSNEGTVNFVASGSSCPSGMACTYTWDFGDGSTGTGVTVSHKYSKNSSGTYDPVTATLDMGALGSSAQVVTPTAPHTAPSCVGDSSFSVTVSGMGASLTDGTTAGSDASPAVYVDWGDGSPMSVGALKGSFNHTYIWPNSVVGYKVTEIVQDGMGFNCVNKTYVKIGNGGGEVTTGNVIINVTSGVNTSYYFKQGGLTKKSGSFTAAEVTAGSATVTLPTGTYDLYLYFATGNTCDYTQGQSATTGDTVDVTCTTP